MTLVRLFLWPLWHVALVSAPWSFKPASLSGHTWLAPTSQIPLHCPSLSTVPAAARLRLAGPLLSAAGLPPPPARLSRGHSGWMRESVN